MKYRGRHLVFGLNFALSIVGALMRAVVMGIITLLLTLIWTFFTEEEPVAITISWYRNPFWQGSLLMSALTVLALPAVLQSVRFQERTKGEAA